MAALRDLKQVDSQTTKLVYGFCRGIHDLFSSHNVYYLLQPTIVDICIAFYWGYEWCEDKSLFESDLFKIEGDIVTKLKSTNGNIFLDNVMSSGVHTYSFRFIGDKHLVFDDGIIGITPDNKASNVVLHGTPFILTKEANSYGFGTAECTKAGIKDWGSPDSYGKESKGGDIIEMIVDLDNMTLRYTINGEDQGIAHKDLDPNTYRVAVYLYDQDCKIELIQ